MWPPVQWPDLAAQLATRQPGYLWNGRARVCVFRDVLMSAVALRFPTCEMCRIPSLLKSQMWEYVRYCRFRTGRTILLKWEYYLAYHLKICSVLIAFFLFNVVLFPSTARPGGTQRAGTFRGGQLHFWGPGGDGRSGGGQSHHLQLSRRKGSSAHHRRPGYENTKTHCWRLRPRLRKTGF